MNEQSNTSQTIVILGGGVSDHGFSTSLESHARSVAAVELAIDNPDAEIIFAGDGRDRENRAHKLPEAVLMMRDFMREFERQVRGNQTQIQRVGNRWRQRLEERIRLEYQSRDTMGNAVFVALRYLQDAAPHAVTLVTSPFHAERARITFEGVLGEEWPVDVHLSEKTENDEKRAANEPGGIDWTRKFLKRSYRGDVAGYAAQLFEERKDRYEHCEWFKRLTEHAAA